MAVVSIFMETPPAGVKRGRLTRGLPVAECHAEIDPERRGDRPALRNDDAE